MVVKVASGAVMAAATTPALVLMSPVASIAPLAVISFAVIAPVAVMVAAFNPAFVEIAPVASITPVAVTSFALTAPDAVTETAFKDDFEAISAASIAPVAVIAEAVMDLETTSLWTVNLSILK